MGWVVKQIKWIMLVCGLLTVSMLFAAIAPQAALLSTFGTTLEGPLAEIIVRSWGLLIALVGGMLIYAAFNPPTRPLVLVVACISKLAFIGLILGYGRDFLGHQAGLDIIVDALMISLFVSYLLGVRRSA